MHLSKIGKFLSRHEWWTLGGILAVYSGVVLGNITRWSIWFDEAFSAYIVRFGFWDITNYTAADVHPPLYYWLLKCWSLLLGNSELALRSMSLVFGLVAIIGMFVLIRRLYRSSMWALVASLAMALTPIVIRFGHEARMYTLALAIVIWATYLLVRMQSSSSKRWWIGYGLLLAAGMLTHYFVALAWLAHWAWRYYEKRTGRIETFFDRQWISVHLLAIGLFAAWIPIAVRQLVVVQGGFWIPPLSAYTPVDYISNTILYREYGAVYGWWAILVFAVVAAGIWTIRRGYLELFRKNRSGTALIVSMALVPPLLLALVSFPPLTSSFIDRYVLYAQSFGVVIIALAIAALLSSRVKQSRRQIFIVCGLLAITFGAGIYNVYYYGNYNKNTDTSIRVKEVMQQISDVGEPAQPVIAASPWIYYEAAFYDSRDYHVYFIDADTEYKFGSLDMLKKSDIGKIKDLDEFTSRHRYVWYLGSKIDGDIQPPRAGWRPIRSVQGYDSIDDSVKYRATLFDTRSSGG